MKSLIVVFLFMGIAMFYCGCSDNPSAPEVNQGDQVTTSLDKKDVKEVYNYKLLPCYPKLPDAHGVIKLKMIDEGEYYFELKAVKLEPGMEYKLKAREAIPVVIVCPYTITDELIGVADKKGALKMSGVLNLRAGYTIYIFTSSDILNVGCFQKILEIEKTFSIPNK